MKKWGIRLIIFLLICVIGIILFVEINKKEIISAAIEEVNQSIKGEIQYGDSDVSLIRSFPDLKVSLFEVLVTSYSATDTSTILKGEQIAVDVKLMTLFRKNEPIKITALSINQADLTLIDFMNGTSNYDIMKSQTETTESNIDFSIENIKIKDSGLSYIDQESEKSVEFDRITLDGRLDYIDENLKINSILESELNIRYNSFLPAYSVNLLADSELKLNQTFDTLIIQNAEISLNDLPIDLDGDLFMNPENFRYQVNISSPSTTFKKLISLLPKYYKEQYQEVISEGSYELAGSFAGTNIGYPIYDLAVIAKNGVIAYPGISKKIDHLSFDMAISNNDAERPYSDISIEKLDFRTGQSKLSGHLNFAQNTVGQSAVFDFNSDLNLKDINEILFQSGSMNMNGLIKGSIKGKMRADPSFKVNRSDTELRTDLVMTDVMLQNSNSDMRLSRATISGDNTRLDFAIDDFIYNNAVEGSAEGAFYKFIDSWINPAQPLEGIATIETVLIDFNKLSSGDSTSNVSYRIPRTHIDIDLTADKLVHSSYVINGLRLNGILNDLKSNMDFTIDEFNGSQLTGSAELQNVLAYGLNNDTLRGNVKIQSDKLLLDRFLLDENTTRDINYQNQLIPSNISLNIDYFSEEIKFKNLDILKSLGNVNIRDQKVLFQNQGNMFGGKVVFSGTFDTDSPNGYHLDLDLQLEELGFRETFNDLRLFSQLLPVAKIMEGRYSARLNWSSDLNESYIPNLNSLSAYGEIATQDGALVGRLPLDTFVRQFITYDDTRAYKISDTKKFFVIENGKVVVKKIVLDRDDITLSMSGSHSFNQALDYQLLIDIPISKFKGDQALKFVQNKFDISKILGTSAVNTQIQLVVYMGGILKKPTFSIQKLNLVNGSVIETLEDRVKTTLSETKESIQKKLTDTIGTVVNNTRDLAKKKIDSTKKVITKVVDSTLLTLDDVIKKEKVRIKNEGSVIVDSIKHGNVDSVLHQIDVLFGKRQGKLDSIRKKIPINILKKPNKKNE